MLSGFRMPEPWHFLIYPSDKTIKSLAATDLGGGKVSIDSVRAHMLPCVYEPVVAFLHSFGVEGNTFCS